MIRIPFTPAIRIPAARRGWASARFERNPPGEELHLPDNLRELLVENLLRDFHSDAYRLQSTPSDGPNPLAERWREAARRPHPPEAGAILLNQVQLQELRGWAES